jgi:hypothetical protein
VQHARTRETSNPLDEIYAILGLVDPDFVKQIKINDSDESREKSYWRAYIELGHLLGAEIPGRNRGPCRTTGSEATV